MFPNLDKLPERQMLPVNEKRNGKIEICWRTYRTTERPTFYIKRYTRYLIQKSREELSALRAVKMKTENRFLGGTSGREENQRKIASHVLGFLLVSAQIRDVKKNWTIGGKKSFAKGKRF